MSAIVRTPQRHTIIVRLNDRPGALYRAIGLIRRRDYNVASLMMGPAETSGTSRMIIVVEASDTHQIVHQLSRLIDVLSVTETPYLEAHSGQFADAMRQFDLSSTTTSEDVAT